MAGTPRTIAVFDFDDTLVKGDSFFPFLCHAVGYPRAIGAFIDSLILYAVRYGNNKNDPALADYRTFIKSHLLKRTIRGQRLASLRPAVAQMNEWVKWNEEIRQKLLDHKSQGHHIVVASGGLDLYLYEILKGLPVDAVICTTVSIEDGIVTGEMSSGNCVRQRKAELVEAYIKQHGPFDSSWGYGNYPHDLPMLGLVKHRILV